MTATKQRKALGKGLDALLPSAPADKEAEGPLREIGIEKIRPNSFQPRVRFPADTLDELAASIRENGLLQPVVVRPSEEGYELIAGERRWRAAQRAGLHRIPALIQSVSNQQMVQLALVENIQRDELSPIEEALAYRLLIEEFHLTQEEVATKVGRSRSAVANTLRLLKLPKPLQEKVLDGALPMGHARALLPLPRPRQIELARRAVKNGWSARQVERRVQRLLRPPEPARPKRKDPNVRQAEEELEEKWRTKVEIRTRGEEKGGQILLHFSDEDDLHRIYTRLMESGG